MISKLCARGLLPNKNKTSATSYGQIALTCLYQLIKKIVNKRLKWSLETRAQRGFRQGRKTIDSFILLENDKQEAFFNKQHTTGICSELLQYGLIAYVTSLHWWYSILAFLLYHNLHWDL